MFTVGAFLLIALLGGLALRAQKKEDESDVDKRVLFIRQDVRLIAFLLAGVLVMLGIIADKLK